MANARNFEPHERVVHKLLGAAYQMTFDEEYDMAVQTAVSAVTYWRKVEHGEMDADEAAELYGATAAEPDDDQTPAPKSSNGETPKHTTNRGERVRVSPGTVAHEVAKVLVYGHDDKYTASEVSERCESSYNSVSANLTMMHQAGWIEREGEGTQYHPYTYYPTDDLKHRVQAIGEGRAQ